MASSMTRALTDSVNIALRKVSANVDGINVTASDAKQASESATKAAASNAQAIAGLDKALSNALAQIKILEARILTLENAAAATTTTTQ